MALRKSSAAQKERDAITLVAGMRANHLTLNKYTSHDGQWGWECTCDCGAPDCKHTVFITRPYRLKNEIIGDVMDHTGSCGSRQASVFKSANRSGTIKSKYTDTIYGGLKIAYETDYIDANRSTVVMCECPVCGKIFPTAKRHNPTSCGCLSNKPFINLEEYLQVNRCKSKGEQKIYDLLNAAKIPFIQEKKFVDCADIVPLPFDFYVNHPIYGSYVIEYDGE